MAEKANMKWKCLMVLLSRVVVVETSETLLN